MFYDNFIAKYFKSSWLIKDFNNLVIVQGQGNFGFLIDYSYFVDQPNVTNVIGDGDLQSWGGIFFLIQQKKILQLI